MSEAQNEQALEWVLAKIAGASRSSGLRTVKTTEEKRREISAKKPLEVELWKKWKDNGKKPEDLDPLLKSFQPMIQSRMNQYRGSEIPASALEHEHKKYVVKALDTWDPSKGTQLQSWVMTNLKRTKRYVDSNKNFARIPENISEHIGSFNAFKSELSEKLGHEPDDQTIHDHILKSGHERLGRLSLKEITRLNREQRKGLIQKGFDIDYLLSDSLDPREEEVKHLIYHQLTPQERLVHEYTFGLNGKPQLPPGEIAKKLGYDASKVSKLRTSILN